MSWLLNLVYAALLVVACPWLLFSAIRKGKYRAGYAAKFLGRVPRRPGNGKCIWLHGVSVGEVNLIEPLLAELDRRFPDYECVISTTTRTGYALACKKYSPRHVFYCPLDFSWSVSRAMRRIRPDLLVLVELELWPNLIWAARRHGAKVAIVNGRLSERSARGYWRIRWLLARVLKSVDLVAVQTAEYAERFLSIGARSNTVKVTGSLKFDGAQTDRGNAVTWRLGRLAGIRPDDIVFLAGSTQWPEEELALATWQTLARAFPHLRLILVPRHPERFNEVAQMLDASGVASQRRSQLAETSPEPPPRVLLVDTVGELGAWWGTSQIAFVGGSMGSRGGQNMIEPSAYGAAVSFGPNTRNFRDVVSLLLENDAACRVADGAELTRFVERCLVDREYRDAIGQRARQLVTRQIGATDRTVQHLCRLLGEPSGESPGESSGDNRRVDSGHPPVRPAESKGTARSRSERQ